MEDPNSTILEEEPAAIAVVPPACTSDNSTGPSSRPGRAMLRCPVDGCFVTRRNKALLNLHVENSNQCPTSTRFCVVEGENGFSRTIYETNFLTIKQINSTTED